MSLLLTSFATSPYFEKPWGNYLLENIVETKPPNAISWLPQTLGWQIVFTFLLLYLGYRIYLSIKTYQKNAYRREALKWLASYESDEEWFYRQLPVLIRKTAISAFGRNQVVPLSGASWEEWLDKHCPQSDFSQQCPLMLHQLAFAKQINFSFAEKQTLKAQVSLWIKQHRRQK